MKKVIYLSLFALLFVSCNNSGSGKDQNDQSSVEATTPEAGTDTASSETANGNPSYDPKRGEGKFTHVDVSPTLNKEMAEAGEKIYKVKCSACHKLTDERLVGPGWKGVTSRHTPEWIMNFVTNTDDMLNKDPKAQALLEICLVRMPNQNLSDEDARNVYEFMRENDGVK
ncbi:MAG TPA: cytochrome c [Hanamia sp.]|jgi:mono/diheme cytochrome c family protein|nr:cytochrome c [Hanamia sp.]